MSFPSRLAPITVSAPAPRPSPASNRFSFVPFVCFCKISSVEKSLPSLLAAFLMAAACLHAAPDDSAAPSRPAWWPAPDLPVYGTPTPQTICVYLLGCVRQPGAYHLEKGATVASALAAAGGTTVYVGWNRYSGLVRAVSSTVPRLIPFKNRPDDEKITLRDGDQIYLGHETW